MSEPKIINIAIGFVTGRLLFQNVLKTYINNWAEHGSINNKNVRIHVLVSYDLRYKNTNTNDYKNVPLALKDLVDSIHFYGVNEVNAEIEHLNQKNIPINTEDCSLLFGEGFAKKRNILTYFAIKLKMDKLLFIDDDEYPLATYKNSDDNLLWMGQKILVTHLKFNKDADITHGLHCGYISPIPYLQFDENLTENDFKLFIDALSNDIISWDKMKQIIINQKGVTYADENILNTSRSYEVEETNGMKFISGANLCFNLKNYKKFPPFYNPPGARGEDTFMSTALTDLKVLKVPCYTFHDGFSMYNNLLNGVLPVQLKAIENTSPEILNRFVQATIGWVRYKPLLVYVTENENFEATMQTMKTNLSYTIPKLCSFFKTDEFNKILVEFEKYRKNVKKHFDDFEKTKATWAVLLQNAI
ncbi:hypothetical protein EGI22_13705 [Lacihabitans sp. LS3-19]|uniref:hypothetical protein n=1 Tax=Lacihabitans sp. LS3-19 TaxID=2487335 RepID=UPI0020CD0E9B|nr:hypothetical protein [Lacihabitans sp. LS3-19]MCP9768970.1 hypothetical protein [Lacihabitans sp. LS3-19]